MECTGEVVHPTGIEPVSTASEAVILSVELRVHLLCPVMRQVTRLKPKTGTSLVKRAAKLPLYTPPCKQ